MSLADKVLKFRRAERSLTKALKEIDPQLTPALAEIILLVADKTPITAGEIGALVPGISIDTVRWQVMQLVRRGYARYAGDEIPSPGRPSRRAEKHQLTLSRSGWRIATMLRS